jgi:4'-phosphopantetheinyl transferase
MEDEIHLWMAYLEPPEAYLRYLWWLLSGDERLRADRFHFQGDRQRFIASRGTLRCILSAHIGLPPEGLEFQYGSSGKPTLSQDCNPIDLQFNPHIHTSWLSTYACSTTRLGSISSISSL